MKILLLDDDVSDVPAIVDVWTLAGAEVTQISNWRDLEKLLQTHKFDAVLIDLMIPAIGLPAIECSTGFTTGEYIYRSIIQPKLGDIPFAVFSAALVGLEVIHAAKTRLSEFAGYRGYFQKGRNNKDILKAIAK